MSYDRYESRRRTQTYGASSRRTTFGYWVPLVFTVTVATFGVAAWIWKERRDNEELERDRKDNRPPPDYGGVEPEQTAYAPGPQYPPPGPEGPQGPHGPGGPPPQSYEPQRQEEQGMVSRMTEVLRRTPSPQQILDEAGRRVTAGVAAAGAAMGSALSSIREEDKVHYEDHSRWSEEADSRPQDQQGVAGPSSNVRAQLQRHSNRRTVAIVVSAEAQDGHGADEATYLQEHASILSHLPEHVDDDSKLFVLIYAPHLKQHPLAGNGQAGPAPPSIASSYSNIGHEDLNTPGDDSGKPLASVEPQPLYSANSTMFDALYAQARALVDKETMIMPFTTPSGYIHMLRQVAPQVVYVQATLAGDNGEHVKNISGWVGQVVLVVGDESGHGGLVDSEDERGATGEEGGSRWWQNDSRIGLGQIEVVEGLRVGEDWRRRVRGHD